MPQPLSELALAVAECLKFTQRRVVFAESCTAGLVSAVLARIPGISEFHCGSAVVYRIPTKAAWLGVPESILQDPGPVSDVVARAMVTGVLSQTPEADLAAAITGHLGPLAPVDQDGLVYVGVGWRSAQAAQVAVQRYVLPAVPDTQEISGADSLREWRQWKAAELVLQAVLDALRSAPRSLAR